MDVFPDPLAPVTPIMRGPELLTRSLGWTLSGAGVGLTAEGLLYSVASARDLCQSQAVHVSREAPNKAALVETPSMVDAKKRAEIIDMKSTIVTRSYLKCKCPTSTSCKYSRDVLR